MGVSETVIPAPIQTALRNGMAIPACPLALTAERKLDERRQRALLRYYAASGVGGIAIGVHTTQFAIRDPKHGLFAPLLTLATDELNRLDTTRTVPLARIGGVCGDTRQAVGEAELLRSLGFHAGLLSLSALRDADEETLLRHCRTVAEILPLFGFYLQPAVGGRNLPYSFWRQFAEIENVVGIKIAPFNRYQTLDVVRALADSGREEIALYTGNDDNIVLDLITPYRFTHGSETVTRYIVGGLLGHWSVWTRLAVKLLEACRQIRESRLPVSPEILRLAIEVTDANAAFFDAANGFRGCIAGLHAVLHRQGLLEGLWCLDPEETLSPGQQEEIDRIYAAYPHLNDDDFVEAHRDAWLK